MNIPRLLIAGTHSGVGKTTICTALMALLTDKGLKVQPYKVGPDYIDPGYHQLATGFTSRNLDTWMLGEDKVQELFYKNAQDKDIALIEGVMGIFDGISGQSSYGSSAHIAKLTSTPVVLIFDVKSMARSAAALVKGFVSFDPELNIVGLILNRVGSESHYRMLVEAIGEVTDLPVLGYVPKNLRVEMPERHLGLVPATEGGFLREGLADMVATLDETVDVPRLLSLAGRETVLEKAKDGVVFGASIEPKVKIGLALDEAFNFYYWDGLDYLERAGAHLIPFSPLKDTQLPEALDGLIIGGGFPEMFLPQLSANLSMLESIRQAHTSNMPIYAECGGYMYLTEAITDFDERRLPMVGIIPYESLMQKRLVAMGYIEACALEDNLIAKAGDVYRGHEFHYSKMGEGSQFTPAFQLKRNRDGQLKYDGYSKDRLLASYVHLHWEAFHEGAKRFIQACTEYRQERLGLHV